MRHGIAKVTGCHPEGMTNISPVLLLIPFLFSSHPSPVSHHSVIISSSFSSTAASIPFFACELKAVSPYRRGFMCGDPSITYPYLHQEAISDELLIAGGIIITGLTVSTHHHHHLLSQHPVRKRRM